MTLWQRWLRQPQSLWLRKAIFQVHLWCGLIIGLYIVALSLTGSLLVYRVELERLAHTPRPAFQPGVEPMSTEALTEAAQRAYPDWEVTRVGNRITRRNPAIEIWVERNGEQLQRLFNPYTGDDLGDALPWKLRALDSVAFLHDELLSEEHGGTLNAIGSALVTLLAVTGLFVWWPGIRNWRRSLTIRRGVSWPRLNWDLHSALGFWGFFLIFMWGATGFYLAWPEPFANYVDSISPPDAILGQRPGDIVLRSATQLHFGRFRDYPALQAIWAVLGLLPAAMFVTGVYMWWNRVLRKRTLDRAA